METKLSLSDTQQPSQGVHPASRSNGPVPDERTPLLVAGSAPTDMSSTTGRGESPASPTSSLRSRKARSLNADGSSLVDGNHSDDEENNDMPTLKRDGAVTHPKWVAFALFSGAFAALNGVFAKLTTSDNTVSLAANIHKLLPFIDANVLTVLLRASFFGLNIASNAIMWVLFTRALTSHPSTTKVSVVNTSANFTITAILGSLVFGEAVGGVGGIFGLALLIGGCVVLGAEEKKDKVPAETTEGVDAEAADALIDEHHVLTGDLIDLEDEIKNKNANRQRQSAGILEGTEAEEDELEH